MCGRRQKRQIGGSHAEQFKKIRYKRKTRGVSTTFRQRGNSADEDRGSQNEAMHTMQSEEGRVDRQIEGSSNR